MGENYRCHEYVTTVFNWRMRVSRIRDKGPLSDIGGNNPTLSVLEGTLLINFFDLA